jgi:ABC-type phosphate transport system permease subunit
MFTDLYNIIYLITVGAWVTCYQHSTGTYEKGAGIGSGLVDTLAIVISYLVIGIEILVGVVIYLSVH